MVIQIFGLARDMASDKKKTGKQAVDMNDEIDKNLRRVYDATLNEDVPDRFHDLLAQLKQKEGPGKNGK